MDAFLAIASKRDARAYADTRIPDDVAGRIVDAGRCAQNMMLAAWNDGVVSCPNGIRDPDAAAAICGGEVKMILSFGYPETPRDPNARTAEEWSARANRRPLAELVRKV